MLGFPKERLFHIRALLLLVVFGGCGGGSCGCSTDAENFVSGGKVSVDPLARVRT